MPRYLKQRDSSYLCGPVALANAMKFLDEKVDWKHDKRWLKILCGYRDGEGCPAKELHRACVQILGHQAGWLFNQAVTLRWLDDELDKGNAAILRVLHGPRKDRAGHYFLAIGRTDKTYQVVNCFGDKTVNRIRRKDLQRYLRYKGNSKNDPCSLGWAIKI